MQNKQGRLNNSRERILNAASQIFLEGGLSALSVRAIAKRAGLSTIGIYSYFEGKQGILDALYIEGFERVDAVLQFDKSNLSQEQILIRASQAYMEVAEKYSAHYRLIFGAADNIYSPSETARSTANTTFNSLLALTSLLLPNGTAPERVREKAINTWAVLHGFAELQRHEIGKTVSPERWRSLATQAVLDSF